MNFQAIPKFILSLSLSSLCFFGSLAQASEGFVGEIRASLLSVEEFQKRYGMEWVLMNGQDLPETSELKSLTNLGKVPDARSRYLRMVDDGANLMSQNERCFSTGNVLDCLTMRPSTPFTSDAKGSHTHSIGENGSHSHTASQVAHSHTTYRATGIGGSSNKTNGCGLYGSNDSFAQQEGKTDSIKPNITIDAIGTHIHSITPADNHSHTINDGGDYETRPKTLLVRFFVKIQDRQDCNAIKIDGRAESAQAKFECLKENISDLASDKIRLSEFEKHQLFGQIRLVRFHLAKNLKSEQISYFDNTVTEKYSQYLDLE